MTKFNRAECYKIYDYLCRKQELNDRTAKWISANLGIRRDLVDVILNSMMTRDLVVRCPVSSTYVYYAKAAGYIEPEHIELEDTELGYTRIVLEGKEDDIKRVMDEMTDAGIEYIVLEDVE